MRAGIIGSSCLRVGDEKKHSWVNVFVQFNFGFSVIPVPFVKLFGG